MMFGKNETRLIEKRDLSRIAILVVIGLVIGVYLIATTVMIASDGVYWIERAQQFSSNSASIIKTSFPGYPFLIFITHKFVMLFSERASVSTWIYSAQGLTLLCRLLALMPLYFIGKLLVGPRRSFWAILILIMLPYPAKFGSDVIREWPHILFLSTGLLFLIWGSRFGKWWMFAISGSAAGLGHMIRPECAQIIIYGLSWLLIRLFFPQHNISRLKAVCLTLILLIGFAIPAVPYMTARGKILPPKLEAIASYNTPWQSGGLEQSGCGDTLAVCTVSGMPTDILNALGKLAQQINENLMHFFVLPLMLGLYSHFRKLRKILLTERFFVFALIALYLVMMVLLHTNYGYLSRRYCVPILSFTTFYIPAGLQILARWLSKKTSKSSLTIKRDRQRWFFMLMAVGLTICTAKFIRITPLRLEKQGYREAAKWLMENTAPEDIIVVPDRRIAFYAKRTMKMMQASTSTVSGREVSSESWHHLVGTFDGKHQKLYINGKLVASAEPGFSDLGLSKDDLAIGKPYAEHASFFQGVIAEVRLYSGALSDEDIEALYDGRISELENEELIGCWTLEGEASGMNDQPGSAMKFNGTSDYIDLSHPGSRLNVDELSVSVWTKPELLKQTNWIVGNKGQFRIGNRNSKVYFWIQERLPGHTIPTDAAYVVAFAEEGSNEKELKFNREIQQEYSVWVDKRKKKKKIAIFKVL